MWMLAIQVPILICRVASPISCAGGDGIVVHLGGNDRVPRGVFGLARTVVILEARDPPPGTSPTASRSNILPLPAVLLR
jgi:hypothetical protein